MGKLALVRDGLGEEVLHKIVNPNTRKLKYKNRAIG
jgi:hypothetical protein